MHFTRRKTAIAVCIASLLSLGVVTAPAGAQNAQQPPGAKADRAGLTSKGKISPSSRRTVAKSRTSKLAKSDLELVARNDATLVPVVVKYDYDSIATYQGEPGGAAPTSPAATGNALTEKTATTSAYAKQVARTEAGITAKVKQAVPSAKIGTSLRVVYGGVAMVIPANQAKNLLQVPGVVAVQEDTLNQKLTDSSPEFIDAPPVWSNLGGQETAGAGVLFGDLDSGVWPEHPSFAANPDLPAAPTRPGGGAIECDYGDDPLTASTDAFECNNKLVGGQGFLETYNVVQPTPELFGDTARDSDGHGTHTTSTAGGNIVEHASPLGVDRGTISGIAPGAAIVEYKVCGIQGCYGSDSAAATGQAILDGVDVINFSISGGTDPLTDPVELAFLDAYEAGVFVASSAGNEGPGASTANHLSPWLVSTAASTQSRAFTSTLTLTGADSTTATYTGASITDGVDTATPVVLASAAPYGHALCDVEPADDTVFAGKIVACERGGNARIEKGYFADQGGAEGMILYNPSLADTETDNHWLPAVHLADGTALKAFIAAHGPVTATFTPGQKSTGQGDVMASFSSRGPAGAFIKPDVTAPGVSILAGQTPVLDAVDLGPAGEYFMAIAGTSMSGPHVAGAGILLKAAHPDWGPGQIKSALMTTATTAVVKEDEETPADPFDMGAGRIDIGRAANPGLTLDETSDDFHELTGTVNAVDLNIPSVNVPVMPGRETTVRTFKNVGTGSATYNVAATAPADSSITVSPSTFTVAAGQSKDVTITITTEGHVGEQQFGQVTLSAAGRNALHLPVAWIPSQASITASSSCAQATLAFGSSTTCDVTVQNNSFGETTADLTSTVNDQLQITSAVGDGATHSATTAGVEGVELAGAQPGVPSLTEADGYEGYFSLPENIGTEADPIGDEEFITYNVPAYVYNGKTYNQISVSSNGYLVTGTATSADQVCCPPPGSPSDAPPNSIIAPYWSDLAGDAGTPAGQPDTGIYADVLTDGTDSWIVIESHLTDCCDGDADHSAIATQVWLGINGEQDVTIDYDPTNLPEDTNIEQGPGDQLAIVGVENEQGEGQYFDPTTDQLPSDFIVESTDPVEGDSYTMTVGVKGKAAGAGVLHTEMTSPDVHGTTTTDSAIAVSAPPATGADAFITRSYQDFLGRNPTGTELSTNRTKLANGTLSRRAFTLGLATSNEYLGHEVDSRYAQILGRAADSGGRAYWIGKLRTGLSETQLVASITGSNEFFTKSGATNAGFADRTYQVLLDRNPTTAERNGIVSQLTGGTASRGGVAKTVYQSEESRRNRVAALYLHFLHRSPDAGGQTYWANVIKTKGDIALALELATSNEYYNRTR